MKTTLAFIPALLLVALVGCGDSKPGEQSQEQPSAETEGKAVAALEKLGAEISKIPAGNVQLVSLNDSEITDADLVYLKGLTNLEYLGLGLLGPSSDNVPITVAGVAELQKALPDCRISNPWAVFNN